MKHASGWIEEKKKYTIFFYVIKNESLNHDIFFVFDKVILCLMITIYHALKVFLGRNGLGMRLNWVSLVLFSNKNPHRHRVV